MYTHLAGTAPLSVDPANFRVLPDGADITRYGKPNWFSDEGVIHVTGSGAMEIEELSVFIDFVHEFAASIIGSRSDALILNGHS